MFEAGVDGGATAWSHVSVYHVSLLTGADRAGRQAVDCSVCSFASVDAAIVLSPLAATARRLRERGRGRHKEEGKGGGAGFLAGEGEGSTIERPGAVTSPYSVEKRPQLSKDEQLYTRRR